MGDERANTTMVWWNGTGPRAELYYLVPALPVDKFAFKRQYTGHICPECGREFQRTIGLARHRRIKHGK